ncbi:MAG: nitroreductase family deazaflavin-dependent oxidoreductase [Halioglobus sp.]|nr:nitroreductase family deazaflavin-dependent oxidoreductase [Halioglobus sp.]
MKLLKTDLVRNALASDAVVAVIRRVVPPLDKVLMRLSRGWLNTGMQTVALIETLGARTGKLRDIVTLCMPEGDSLILVGSNWGQPRDPAWVHNMRANPQVHVRYRGFVGPMIASEVTGEAREALWQRLVQHNPQYAHYQAGTTRTLPVIRLQRIG